MSHPVGAGRPPGGEAAGAARGRGGRGRGPRRAPRRARASAGSGRRPGSSRARGAARPPCARRAWRSRPAATIGTARRSGSRPRARLREARRTGPSQSAGGASWAWRGVSRFGPKKALQPTSPAAAATRALPAKLATGEQIARPGRLLLGLVEELLRHEAEQRRQSRHREGGGHDREGGERHGLRQPAEEADVARARLVVDRSHPEEERRLVERVDEQEHHRRPGRELGRDARRAAVSVPSALTVVKARRRLRSVWP